MTEYRDARTHAPGGPASPPRQGPVRVVGGSDFGTQTVGTTSTVRYFSVQDTGLVDLTVQRIELRGTDAASFTMLSRCGATLDVGARCNVRVSFAPQTAGAKAAKLAVVFALCEGSGAVT